MKKREEKTYRIINYENESVDVTYTMIKYLQENDYYENSELENLEILEKGLINYSILKLNSWNYKIENLSAYELTSLDGILSVINNTIPNYKQKTHFFNQYIHCIIYIIGEIKKQPQITWKKTEIKDYELLYDDINSSKTDILIEENNGIINKITTNKQADISKIPSELIQVFKTKFQNIDTKKVSVLHK